MTTAERELTRPEFESVDLDIGRDAARDRIEETIKGLADSETEEGINYRTMDGTLVAVVGTPRDRDGATLAYRTAPAAMSATRKASRLREALDAHVVHDADTTEA